MQNLRTHQKLVLYQNSQGEEDSSGRARPVEIEGSNFTIDCDVVIVAIGQGPNPLITKDSDLKCGKKNTIEVDEDMSSSIKGVYAGGDIATGGTTVIEALSDGKKAAFSIHKYLSKSS